MNQDQLNNIELIQSIFMDVSRGYIDDESLPEYAKKYNGQFLSLVYEAAAFKTALKGRKEWSDFAEQYISIHSNQIYIGLGWAFANKGEISFDFENQNKAYVFDGIGYYLAMFKKSQTVDNQVIPEFVRDSELIYRGIGRAMMYLHKANIDELSDAIQKFPERYRSKLWEGVGIAFSYIRGFDENEIQLLIAKCEDYIESVKAGVNSVLESTKLAGTYTSELDLLKKYI